ncbi:MAG: RNA-binding protein [Rickettsiales bacterium]|nr:RNA-binding protein [Rickettsiales bacterium]
MKLTALNLPRRMTENELALLFKKYGNIKACTIVLDAKTGASKGFGFIEMALAHEAALAVKELNGRVIDSKKIRVKPAE